MRASLGRARGTRALVSGAALGATCVIAGLVPGSGVVAAPSVPGLPVQAKGLLGTLDTVGPEAHTLVFDTSAGRYSLDGAKSDLDDRRAIRMADGRTTPVFDFDALRLGPSTVVRVRGKNPLVLLSKGDVSIATPLKLDGKPGADNGRGAGGGGGGGGGAVAIFAKGMLTVSSLISVNGGPGGVGNAAWSPIYGGDGGAGGVTLASAEKVELLGTISALSGGKAGGTHGPVVLAGPVAFGAEAVVNGVPATKASTLQVWRSIAKGTLTISGGSGGGGGGGTGLPEVVTPDYVKTNSPGGLGGPGGLAGGAGAYAVAGGKGAEGGAGLYAGGGGGGGGAYLGPGGAGGSGPAAGGAGAAGGGGSCSAAVAGGTGGSGGNGGGAGGAAGAASGGNGGTGGNGAAHRQGGGGGGGGGASGGHGGNGGTGNISAGGGGGGGGADGCGGTAPGNAGRGGAGGVAAVPGAEPAPGRTTDPLFVSSGVGIRDASGVDFDAACGIPDPTKITPPGENNVDSPGSAGGTFDGGDGCDGVSTYDGSTESTDLNQVTLGTNGVDNAGASDNQLVATWRFDGPLPAPGGTCNPLTGAGGGTCVDLPNNALAGFGFKTLFQVPARQNNTPTNPVGGGCPRNATGIVYDQHGHWLDGYHHFVGFDAAWDGTRWIHSAQVGTYDPSPDGAFFFTELGTNSGNGWQTADPNMVFGSNWNVTYGPGFQVAVTVDGVVQSGDLVNCAAPGIFHTVYFKDGDMIANVKGLSTANGTATLPATIPLSVVPGFSDITSIGGFTSFSDITEGNSVNSGLVGSLLKDLVLGNRENVSFTGGFLGIPGALSVSGGLAGVLGNVDTLGDSPACPTETFGGTLPPNPFVNEFVGCQYDDDNIPVPNSGDLDGPWWAINPGERGTFLTEWWDTTHSFVA
jgi:hypothetical protein